jgi:hypothetical protein
MVSLLRYPLKEAKIKIPNDFIHWGLNTASRLKFKENLSCFG